MSKPTLLEALGAMGAAGADGPWASPTSERQLTELLQILAAHGASLGRDVHLSRAGFAQLGPVAARSATVLLGAGVRLQTAEAALREQGLTLGALPPGALGLTLARFLEGPYAGLRAVSGGRLEPICQAVSGVLGDGRVLSTPDSPRSAAGPELMALVLGGEGRLALVTRATVRCFPWHDARRSAAFAFASAGHAVAALRAVLSDGVLPEWAALDAQGLTVGLAGAESALERDVATLQRRAGQHGGRAQAASLAASDQGGVEREATWPEIVRAASGGALLGLHRLSLATAVVTGPVSGLVVAPDAVGALPPLALLTAFDPRHVLGPPP